jgi:tetratricopeptide (TPR) repeat protein
MQTKYRRILSEHYFRTFSSLSLLVGIGIVLVMIFFYSFLLAQPDKDVMSFANLQYGPYSVGYKVLHEYDYSRTYRFRRDFEGKPTEGEIARPIQIQIWYPAAGDAGLQRMKVVDYFRAVLSQFDFSKVELARSDEALAMARGQVLMPGIDPEKADRILSRETKAVLDAQPREGAFPLILYGPGGDMSPWDNTVMMEYLASHGYVVAASPTFFAYEGEDVYNTQRLESRVRDFEFVMAQMLNFPSVDKDRIAALGWSWGGISAAAFAMRNQMVSAVACLDGSMAYDEYAKPALKHFDYDYKRLRVPFLFLAQKQQNFQNLGFFDKLLYSDAYLFQFNDMVHQNFSSGVNWLESVRTAPSDIAGAGVELSYETVCRYLLEFFNGYLKDDASGRQFLANSPEVNGILGGVVTSVQRKEAHAAPPSAAEFLKLIRSGGAAEAVDVYHKAVAVDPELVLFDEAVMNEIAYDFLNRGKREEAVMLFELNAEAYPDSWTARDGLGAAFEAAGDLVKAKEAINKSLEIYPAGRVARTALDRLQGGSSTVNPEGMKKYVGEYSNGEITIVIEVRGNHLLAGIPGQPPKTGVPVDERTFVDPDGKGFSVQFKLDASGVVEGFLFRQPRGESFFKRISESESVSSADVHEHMAAESAGVDQVNLDLYVGIYSAPGLGTIDVRVKDGILVLMGNPLVELKLVAPHRFEGTTPLGLTTIDFILDSTGKVTELIASTSQRSFEFKRQ